VWGEDTVKLSDKGRHTQGHVVGGQRSYESATKVDTSHGGPAKRTADRFA
jgi:hypothetical protein